MCSYVHYTFIYKNVKVTPKIGYTVLMKEGIHIHTQWFIIMYMYVFV